MWKGEREQGKVWLNKEKQAVNFFQLKDKFLQRALKFRIIIQPTMETEIWKKCAKWSLAKPYPSLHITAKSHQVALKF